MNWNLAALILFLFFLLGMGIYAINQPEKIECIKFEKPILECSCNKYPREDVIGNFSFGIYCMYYGGITSGRNAGFYCGGDLLDYYNTHLSNSIMSDISCQDAFDKLEIRHIDELNIIYE